MTLNAARFSDALAALVKISNRAAKLKRERDEARRVAVKLRDDAERPGGGRQVLPWEKKQ